MTNKPAIIAAALAGAVVGASAMHLWMVQPKTYVGIARVLDGDSIKIGKKHIRLVGINTPELPKGCRYLQRVPGCNEPAAEALHRRIAGKKITCVETGRGVFGRILGVCYHGATELNVWLINECLAHSPKRKAHRNPRYEAMIKKRVCGK